ncbi:spermidine synthase [Sphingomonas sp. MG17]|uniref:Spermidine synthase n=1 Tax=Sphingomonas tagetis TaxID=2949092 RepID=A0A9X2KNM0_9SPHN|nr:spermidine synthase [Sphingomonas tagetis]MCP3733000.1 spermidine synthase [Sphingomonas tagetis]
MTPRELIDVAEVPGGEPLRLFRRGGDFMIVLNRNELMSSRMSGSEEALAELTLARLKAPGSAHLLIGGYGMGFTLRKALALMGPDGRAKVAELVPKIVEWARGPMAELAAGCLDDPRTEIMLDDVGSVIGRARAMYDAILLDVDNGPDGLTRLDNDRLYTMRGLDKARLALKPGGVLAVWSAAPDDRFRRRMGDAGFSVEEVAVRARQNGKGPRHVIWFGVKR